MLLTPGITATLTIMAWHATEEEIAGQQLSLTRPPALTATDRPRRGSMTPTTTGPAGPAASMPSATLTGQNNMSTNIRAIITLKSSNAGGRNSLVSAPYFSFRLQIGSSFYDAQGYLRENEIVSPGDRKVVMVKFLDPDAVMPKLKIGDRLPLWERQSIGQLEVLEIFQSSEKKQENDPFSHHPADGMG